MIGVMADAMGKRREGGGFATGLSIGDAVRGWGERGLAVVCGGGPVWGVTVLGEAGERFQSSKAAKQQIRSGGSGVLGEIRNVLHRGQSHWSPKGATSATHVLSGGWVISISYGLGGEIEPRTAGRVGSWPLVEMQRCDRVVGFDHARGEWVGDLGLLAGVKEHGCPKAATRGTSGTGFEVGDLVSDTGRERYERMVARAVEYIRAGDVFQVNLAHRLSGTFSGSTRWAFAALMERARPWHGGYMELAGEERRALLSMSPELFLRVEGNRVMTRPMKGTRSAARDASELRESGKDLAELNMIIDLMRNDLGRVCRFGSVRVEGGREIELHGGSTSPQEHRATGPHLEGNSGVWQGVGTVVGELREGMDVVDLLAAAFPAGSVTGAPKIRAMQIIDELEVGERGPYCGSIGWIGDDGRACLNVAIRTACISGLAGAGVDEVVGGTLNYSVGAGIVAESEPAREWEETLEKAGVMAGFVSRRGDLT